MDLTFEYMLAINNYNEHYQRNLVVGIEPQGHLNWNFRLYL